MADGSHDQTLYLKFQHFGAWRSGAVYCQEACGQATACLARQEHPSRRSIEV